MLEIVCMRIDVVKPVVVGLVLMGRRYGSESVEKENEAFFGLFDSEWLIEIKKYRWCRCPQGVNKRLE